MTLGEKIREYREQHDISLRAFSRLCGLSPTYISYLEKGITQRGKAPVASIETYRVVAKAMGKDVDALIREVDDMVSINSNKPPIPDDELEELLYTLSNRSDLHMLFSLAKDASPEDVRVAAELIKNLRGRYNE